MDELQVLLQTSKCSEMGNGRSLSAEDVKCYDEPLWRWTSHSLKMGGAKSQKGSNRGSGAGLPSEMYSHMISKREADHKVWLYSYD